MVVRTGTGETLNLGETRQVLSVRLRGKRGAVVGDILLGLNASIKTHKFETFLRDESFVGVKVGLKLDVDQAGGMINEDAPSHKHLFGCSFPKGAEETSASGTNEVSDRHTLPWEGMIGFKDPLTFACNVCSVSGCCTTALLGKLTGSTLGWS